jgi:DnaJ-class molecular chaperone
MVMIICSNCKGNGYIRIRFEAEESIHQCKVCNSQGEIEEEKEEEQQKFTAGHISSSF